MYLIEDNNKSIDREKHVITIGGDEEVKVDKIDMQILNVIASNSRIPITKIAQILDLSVKIVHYRLKRNLFLQYLFLHIQAVPWYHKS